MSTPAVVLLSVDILKWKNCKEKKWLQEGKVGGGGDKQAVFRAPRATCPVGGYCLLL